MDYLAVPDLLRFARVSRRMHEMVYDDTRWQKRLRKIGSWNESQATQKVEPLQHPAGSVSHRRQPTTDSAAVNGKGRPEVVLNGVGTHAKKQSLITSPSSARADDGFDSIVFAGPASQNRQPAQGEKESALTVISSVRSIRGRARQEYAKIYRTLAPFYKDALANPSTTSLVFRSFPSPEQQARMLVQIRLFARSDFSPGSGIRDQSLERIFNMFDTAALLEFRNGYEYKDIQGQMKQYAHVMSILNGGQSSIDMFLVDNHLLKEKHKLGNVSDCIDYSLGYGELSLERVQAYFERLGSAYAQETAIIQTVFPQAEVVSLLFLQKIAEEVLAPFLTALFLDARTRNTSMYLRVISGTFAAVKQFLLNYALPPNPDEATILRANEVMIKIYEPHMDLYLDEEFTFFKQKADKEVQQWDQVLSDQAASTETFLMSNINRQADKKDFMSSFKKVVMMPVNILPRISSSSSKSSAKVASNGDSSLTAPHSRASTPSANPRSATPTLPAEAPTTELAAKAALMATRLEGIKSLFSIEVALNLVHAAKSSLERAAQFVSLGSTVGEQARKQSAAIYVLLLDTIGNRHVKSGFDKAIDHLSSYNPRATHGRDREKVDQYQQPNVAPLTTFLELVNVGDLIQQMLDVFFESELIAHSITQRDDFLNPAVKEKRRFEQMLDEQVATGLSKGIDVLMDEVEFICATEQQPSDYNPAFFDANSGIVTTLKSSHSSSARPMSVAQDIDLSPTPACTHIIGLIRTHHSMLQGTTDKTLLDVFTSELSHRLFSTLIKHLKRQRISPTGAMKLLMDLSQYGQFIATFKNPELNRLFEALREVGQIYLFEGNSDKEVNEMCEVITDAERYSGVFGVEEVVEFCERRVDWFAVRGRVEGKVRGEGCTVM